MRLAIITDIHGNYRAFQSVLDDISSQDVEAVVSLGDNVGYGPEPDEVVCALRERNITSLRGNHELALTSRDYYNKLNPPTRLSLDLTRELLTSSSLDWLATLPPTLKLPDGLFVHGCPPDSTTTYLLNPSTSRLHRIFASYPEFICFAGHTHTLETYINQPDDTFEQGHLSIGVTKLDREKRYIIIPGSVGQPRDNISNKAKYGIWDQEFDSVEIRAVSYDVSTTVKLINERGFPASNGLRLQW
jgi:predicted phosphodiesterase